MFGKNLGIDKERTVLQNPDRVVMDYGDVHREHLKWQKFVTIVADVIFVNGTPLLINMSRSIKLDNFKQMTT